MVDPDELDVHEILEDEDEHDEHHEQVGEPTFDLL